MQKVNTFETATSMAEAAANYIIKLAAVAIAAKGKFTIALSGGNTPIALYALLATPAYSRQINWKKVFVFWSDERCVQLDSSENNAYVANEVLLKKVPIPRQNIFTIPVAESPVNAAIYYEATIKIFFKTDKPVFDVILLGLGEDGHTASLFPYTDILQEKKLLVKDVFLADKNWKRISFTVPIINLAEHKIFLVAGKSKARILAQIVDGERDTEKYPAQMIHTAEWFVSLLN